MMVLYDGLIERVVNMYYHGLLNKTSSQNRFYGNQCVHYTLANETDTTRVSLDFRVVPSPVFDPDPPNSRGPDGKQKFTVVFGGFGVGSNLQQESSAYFRQCDHDAEKNLFRIRT